MSDELKKTEKAAYAKGYAAGRRRLETDMRAEEKRVEDDEFRRRVFLAALTGTLENGGWSTGDKAWRTIEDYVRGCWKFGDAALKFEYRP